MPYVLKRVLESEPPIPKHSFNPDCEYLKDRGCYYCCDGCNYDIHQCYFCGEDLMHGDRDFTGEPHECYDYEDHLAYMSILKQAGAIKEGE